MLQLAYSNQVRQITVNSASRIYYTLVGAGGGGGGSDSAGGTRGTSGDKVGGFVDVNANETLYVAVGEGGGAGASRSAYATGGSGGASLIGFSGGNGGNAGPWGSSGAGGGGGGATVLYRIVNGLRQYIAVASGGAGGGGGGNRVSGVFSGDSYLGSSTSSIPSTYPDAGSDRAWNNIGNDYGVWDYTYYPWAWANFTWTFNAPYTGTYTVRLSADNYGSFSRNNIAVLSTPGDSRASNYNSYVETSFSMNAGLNILKLSGANSGGPAFLGALVYNNSGTLVWSSKSTPNIGTQAQGMGGDGQQHRYDGGGGGGGGGGHIGGRGGYVAGDLRYVNDVYGSGYFGYADWGAMSGSRGTSINYGTSVTVGAGGGSMNNDYGTFGAAGSNGTSGYAAFSSKTTSLSAYSGNWKTVSDVYIRQNNQWIEPKNVYVRQNDEWVNMYSNNVPAATTASSEPFIRSSWREVQFIEYPAPAYNYDA